MAPTKVREPELTEAGAIVAYQKAVQEHPDASAHFNLGTAYYIAHQPDVAEGEFRQALAMAPGLDHAHYYLGAIYKLQGKKDLARQEFRLVIDSSAHSMLKHQAAIQLQAMDAK